MNKTRDNHYVPQWYQKGFTDARDNELRHLKRKIIDTPRGLKTVYSKRWYTPTQCFYQTDLYTTFFGSDISDEIEQKLFGHIDDNGSVAVKAFLTDDQSQWHHHFQDFFIYLDAQKLRTPKGLDWVRSKYPALNQNELMTEMQAIRSLHCTLWAEGVRELVSAETSEAKFIVSDHPITVYNYACPPDSELCDYPNDPDIALKGSQTIFPLNKNRCLILTNLEYAKDPDGVDPLELRTNAIRIRQSMVNTIEFINTRKLTVDEVTKINYIIKSRAKESVAAGKEPWLHPENDIKCDWAELRRVLLPPSDELHRFGGEMFVHYDNGTTHYQDAFGRTTQQHNFFDKDTDEASLGRNDYCGCGSGRKYKSCCRGIPGHLRTTWDVASIRERNLTFCNAIRNILGLNKGKTWLDVRREISDEQISEIYQFYGVLWPRETDIYALLPKSDGKFRALYSGILDVRVIGAYALPMATYFDEFMIESPLLNPNNLKPEFSPIDLPSKYMYQALKDFLFMLEMEPYIGYGLINIIPNPINFDLHLQREMMDMANIRRDEVVSERDTRLQQRLATEDLLNSIHMAPRDVKVKTLMHDLGLPERLAKESIDALDANAENAPLTLLRPMQPGDGGLFMQYRMGPNYEMSLFIAQVTGSVIMTDSEFRWIELQRAQHRTKGIVNYPWHDIFRQLVSIPMDYQMTDNFRKSSDHQFVQARELLNFADELVRTDDRDVTRVAQLEQQAAELAELLNGAEIDQEIVAEVKVLSPERGIYDRTVQRLLVRSGCPRHDDQVRSVYYVGHQL